MIYRVNFFKKYDFANLPSLPDEMDNKTSSWLSYSSYTISKTNGEQRWLLLAQNREQVSIFAFNVGIALT